MTNFKLALFAALLGVALAAPSRRSPHVLHETRAFEPLDWVPVGRLDSNKVLPMRFGLVQQNLHLVEELLMAVSQPESPSYGKHYTPADVVDTFAPSEETISTVTNWLVDSGFAPNRLRLSANKGWISLEATASEVEDLLKAEYHVYNHASGDQQFGWSSWIGTQSKVNLFFC
jgi:tripeptidyl-peptidase-1